MSLLDSLKAAQKEAMKAKDKIKLGTIRMVLSAIQRKEVDEQVKLNESEILTILTKEVKSRVDAKSQFEQAGREDLATKEAQEIEVLETFLPKPLTEQEILELIEQAIDQTQASSMQDMGKLMATLKPSLNGRADMGKVSGIIRSKLS